MSQTCAGVTVRALQPQDVAAWDRFVLKMDQATFFHRSGWKQVLEEAFGHKTYYLLAEADGVIVGVLPLGRIHSLLFGDALISTPFCVYGGIVAVDGAVAMVLEQEAVSLAHRLGVDHLEMRATAPVHPQWLTKDLYCTFKKTIFPDADANLRAIPRKQRAEVRRGISKGLTGMVDHAVETICYDIYSESVRNLGTPVFPRRFFSVLKKVFGADCDALVIRQQKRPVAAVLNFYFRDQVLPYYGGSIAEGRELGATPFMYYDLMNRAAGERGVRVFDFGRSKVGSGPYDFKRYFGFEPQALHYAFHLVRGTDMPNISPNNPKYQMFIRLWKTLPLGLSRRLGPMLAKNLG
ncbi:MAG: FAD/FMN-containing dehydrogenase [Magnetococcales bacterium]|nr:FAD/FMN-containing dehydrogenase [Magnetococcales bacterium]HIJ86011.1 FemAB family PEP-CTERM system-associated protein [Magnetococcales bacterium]